MKIDGMIDFITQIASKRIDVNQSRCVLVRNRNADCLRCADACVSGCIHYQDNELIISPLLCIGCNTCCTVCPTGALTPKDPTDEQLLLYCERAAAANDGVVTVVCDRVMERAGSQIDSEKVVAVPCIGRVDESLLTSLAADEVRRIVLVDAFCEGCEYVAGHQAAELVRETAQVLFDTWHCHCKLQISGKLPASVHKNMQDEDYDRSRRALFSTVKNKGLQVGAEAAETYVEDTLGVDMSTLTGEDNPPADGAPQHNQAQHTGPTYVKVNEQGVLPHFVPDRRTQLIESLRRLGEPDDIMFNVRLWGNVIVDPNKCRSCYMCATFCPTGAMRKIIDEEGVAHGVGHYPSYCVKCRTCENICMAHAISISEEVFATDMLAGMTEHINMDAQGPNIAEQFGLGKGLLKGALTS